MSSATEKYEAFVSSLPKERLEDIVKGLILIVMISPQASNMAIQMAVTGENPGFTKTGWKHLQEALKFMADGGRMVPQFEAQDDDAKADN